MFQKNFHFGSFGSEGKTVTLILESVSFISCILPTNVAKLRITDAYSGLHQTAKSESFANLDFPKFPNVTFYALDCLFSLSVGILLTLHKTNFFVVNEKSMKNYPYRQYNVL